MAAILKVTKSLLLHLELNSKEQMQHASCRNLACCMHFPPDWGLCWMQTLWWVKVCASYLGLEPWHSDSELTCSTSRGRKKNLCTCLHEATLHQFFWILRIEIYQWSSTWQCYPLSATFVLYCATFCSRQLCHNEKESLVWPFKDYLLFFKPFISCNAISAAQTSSSIQI